MNIIINIFTIIYTIFQETIDEFDTPINVSRLIKSEIIEEDEYEYDSVYESDITYENDIGYKTEFLEDEEYEEEYYEEVDLSNVYYTFRKNETVSVDVVLFNNSTQVFLQ